MHLEQIDAEDVNPKNYVLKQRKEEAYKVNTTLNRHL